jgi:hypothetical protein
MIRTAKKEKTRTTFPPISMVWVKRIAVVMVIIWLVHAFGVSVSAAVGVYLGYRVIRLVMRLFGQILSIVFTIISIAILIAIISLITL